MNNKVGLALEPVIISNLNQTLLWNIKGRNYTKTHDMRWLLYALHVTYSITFAYIHLQKTLCIKYAFFSAIIKQYDIWSVQSYSIIDITNFCDELKSIEQLNTPHSLRLSVCYEHVDCVSLLEHCATWTLKGHWEWYAKFIWGDMKETLGFYPYIGRKPCPTVVSVQNILRIINHLLADAAGRPHPALVVPSLSRNPIREYTPVRQAVPHKLFQ